MTISRFTSAMGVVATVVGLLNVVGVVGDLPFLTKIGNTFAISPAPSPYSIFVHGEAVSFGCEDRQGKVDWHEWSYKVRGAVPGPHHRVVTLLAYFAHLLLAMKHDTDVPSVNSRTQYYFCRGGPVARVAGCAADMKAVLFRFPKQMPNGQPKLKRVACLND